MLENSWVSNHDLPRFVEARQRLRESHYEDSLHGDTTGINQREPLSGAGVLPKLYPTLTGKFVVLLSGARQSGPHEFLLTSAEPELRPHPKTLRQLTSSAGEIAPELILLG